ncbi:restriction endonuclease [Leucobacter sp. UT-8R-CII-1-4]|uniref:restriction endonuclease n=1 Tax=Leucobacter sp. UT-8R-CII-1-4 TaxID=3040075 RepID=UPI0024A83198|nr:restriction endonuclease [Leucobacter sp. UT-8R-CII-1-4]MDI6023900.1 restriction endonuclease [Leucobacter sp. UT-8R-CII-1-4]
MWSMESLRQSFNEWHKREKGKPAAPGDFLESYVAYKYDSLLARHARNIVVTKQAKIPDIFGNIYDIDVFFEYEVAGIKHRVAIECKDHKRPVNRDDVLAFCGKIKDMPSTIGVFVSASGFQSGAQKYLDDHGVKHIGPDEFFNFGRIVADRFLAPLLPEESAIAQPFWVIMEKRNDRLTGSWASIPPALAGWEAKTKRQTIPLFMSRRDAKEFWASVYAGADSWCIRGLEQPSLRVFIGVAKASDLTFAVFKSLGPAEQPQFEVEPYSPQELEEEFLFI